MKKKVLIKLILIIFTLMPSIIVLNDAAAYGCAVNEDCNGYNSLTATPVAGRILVPELIHFSPVTATPTWMDLWGILLIDGVDADVGDEVGAFVGADCFGAYIVDVSGWFGFLLIYGDDALTPEKDGASSGDILTIKVWDSSEGVEYTMTGNDYTGPDPLIWTDGSVVQTDIDVILAECRSDEECNDNNICTDDACVDNVCQYTDNNTRACDDGKFCNGSELCNNGICSIHSGDPCPPLICFESFSACFSDNDSDGIADDGDNSTIPGDNPCVIGQTENCDDNCPNTPNGPDNGTCVQEVGNIVIIGTGITCTDNSTCEEREYCQKEQGDINGNGAGDACECYADFNDNGKIDGGDMFILINEANASFRNCEPDASTSPPCCYADANGNGRIDGGDMGVVVYEANAGRRNCPIIPHCPNVP